jgi:hypothetical protein
MAALILAASGVVAAAPDMAGAAPVPMVNDRECPSTAPIKTQVDNDIFCKTIPEFCATNLQVQNCMSSVAPTTVAPGELRQRYSDDYLEVPGPVDGSRCPGSHPVATQVDNLLVCYTLSGFCETRFPTWYDPSRGLYCPGATTTTTLAPAPPTPAPTGTIAPSQLTEVRAERAGSAFVLPPEMLSVQQNGGGTEPTIVTIKATKRGSRSITFSLRTRAGRPIEIPSSLSKRGYRLSIFVDGVQMLVIPATR